MEEVIDIRTLQCYQKATEEQRKKCTSKLSFEIGKLPTLKLQEEWTFYIKHCGEVKSLSSVRQETVYFKRVCESPVGRQYEGSDESSMGTAV